MLRSNRPPISKRPKCHTVANRVGPLFQRLVGLETEYAIRYVPDDPTQPPPAKFAIFEAVRAAVERRVLAVPAKHFKEGVFTANGGAVWFEAERPSAGGGLIEGATPECHSPRELLAYQRAQDTLLSECAAKADLPGRLTLIKNDRDAKGNVYGAQENYQATIATGPRLWLWRLGLIALFPLAVLTWAGILLSVFATLCYFAVAGLLYLPLRLVTGGSVSLALFLFGRDLVDGRETCVHVPVWLESTLQAVTRVLTGPLALCLYFLLWLVAFRTQRDRLVAFLATRPIFAGAGLVNAADEFQLSDKAPAINCQVGFGGMLYDRPIFSMGHFFKEIYAESWFSPRNYWGLFAPRQRLQIALGDSNMCETAELLRIGTTLLVLDAIEAGAFDNEFPQVRRPIKTLHAVCSDPTLAAQVPLSGGGSATALEIQRIYADRCEQFLRDHPAATEEAWDILRLWKSTLDSLELLAVDQESCDQLLGKLDWVTKKRLLDQAVADKSWLERKKVDIGYHEMSDEGYYRMLAAGGLSPSWAEPAEVDRAIRTPPADSPATTRGHYIREFARTGTAVSVNWKSVVLGSHWQSRVIRIADYGRAPTRGDLSARVRTSLDHRHARDE